MFNDTKYTKIYYRLIQKHKSEKKFDTERHHIIPKSIGGTNFSENLVYVSTRVHFILHKLLVKMIDDKKSKQKMTFALWRMMHPQTKKHHRVYNVSSSDYATYRKLIKQYMIENNPMKDPNISNKFRKKRPEHSKVATERNLKYWKDKKIPMLIITCVTCNNNFTTNNAKRICCNKSCAALYRNKMRRLGNKVRLGPQSTND
jgi:hypothetical protein